MRKNSLQKKEKKPKKIWFKAITHNLWMPISKEGWLAMAYLLFWSYSLLSRASHETIVLSRDWALLLEFIIFMVLNYFVFRGRAEK